MRNAFFLAVLLAGTSGCTHGQLETSTLNQISTISDLRYQEVLDNLAVFVHNPSALPYFVVISGGTAQVADTGQGSPGVIFDKLGLNQASLNLMVNRNVQENWSLDPVSNPDKLAAMRCVFQYTLAGPAQASGDCEEIFNRFHLQKELAKVPPGWFHVGCKKDVPREACYVGCCHGAYVWITPDGLEGLTRFTLVLLDIATVDLSSLATEVEKKAVETYTYDDKGKLKRVEKLTEPITDSEAGPQLKPRREYHGDIRGLLNLRH